MSDWVLLIPDLFKEGKRPVFLCTVTNTKVTSIACSPYAYSPGLREGGPCHFSPGSVGGWQHMQHWSLPGLWLVFKAPCQDFSVGGAGGLESGFRASSVQHGHDINSSSPDVSDHLYSAPYLLATRAWPACNWSLFLGWTSIKVWGLVFIFFFHLKLRNRDLINPWCNCFILLRWFGNP